MNIAGALHMAHRLLLSALPKATVIVDATAGNGKDTLFLARNALPQAQIWAFDIQHQAIEATRNLLMQEGISASINYVLDSHSNMDWYLKQPVDIISYNLGYLPGGDHSIATMASTTIIAMRKSLALLASGGLMTVVVYPGHPAGREEAEELAAFFVNLRQQKFTVACWSMVNQVNCPPILYAVEKKKEGAYESLTSCQD